MHTFLLLNCYLCENNTMAFPEDLVCFTMSSNLRRDTGSTPAVSSSKKTTFGLPINDTAKHNFRLSPSVYVLQ